MEYVNDSCTNTTEEEQPTFVTGHTIFIFTLGIIGIIGNILALRVLLQRNMNSTFNKLRAALAVFDALLLLCAINLFTNVKGAVFIYLWWPMGNFAHTASIFMTMAIAIERFVAISDPHGYRKNQRYRTTKYVSAVTISALMLNIIAFFEFEVGCNSTKIPLPVGLTYTKAYRTLGFTIYYSVILNLLFKGLIPTTLLLSVYTKIYAKLKRIHHERMNSTTNNAIEQRCTVQQEKMARIFAGVVIVYLISAIPHVVVKIIDLFFIATSSFDADQPEWYFIGLKLRDFLGMLNSVVNIVIYTLLDKKFGRECRKVLQIGCKCEDNNTPSNTISMTPMKRERNVDSSGNEDLK